MNDKDEWRELVRTMFGPRARMLRLEITEEERQVVRSLFGTPKPPRVLDAPVQPNREGGAVSEQTLGDNLRDLDD